MSHRHITFLSARSTSGFFLAEAINAHFVWAELVDDEDQVFDLEMGSGVLVKEANIFVINQNFRRQILKPGRESGSPNQVRSLPSALNIWMTCDMASTA